MNKSLFCLGSLLLLVGLSFAGCSGEAPGSATTRATLQARRTPVPPNPADLEATVRRFYHAIRQGKLTQAWLLGSPNFRRNHTWKDFWASFYAMDEPDEQLDDVTGTRVDYTLKYSNIGQSKVSKLLWLRHGSWTLVHGSAGWMIDDGSIENDKIVGVIGPDGTHFDVLNDQVVSDTQHLFTIQIRSYQAEFSYTRKPNGGWQVAFVKFVGLPTEEPRAQPYGAQEPESGATANPYIAPAEPEPDTDCETDTIDTVAEDGSFVKMISGDGYTIADADLSTVALWLASDDVTICDEGTYYKLIDGSDVAEGYKVGG